MHLIVCEYFLISVQLATTNFLVYKVITVALPPKELVKMGPLLLTSTFSKTPASLTHQDKYTNTQFHREITDRDTSYNAILKNTNTKTK